MCFFRRQSHRRKGAQTVTSSTEYDVQDLLHTRLRAWVSDIRPEEFASSHAGSSPGMESFLPAHALVAELKLARERAQAKRVGDEPITDIEHDRVRRECKTLWCVVYDPDHVLLSAEGVPTDLER